MMRVNAREILFDIADGMSARFEVTWIATARCGNRISSLGQRDASERRCLSAGTPFLRPPRFPDVLNLFSLTIIERQAGPHEGIDDESFNLRQSGFAFGPRLCGCATSHLRVGRGIDLRGSDPVVFLLCRRQKPLRTFKLRNQRRMRRTPKFLVHSIPMPACR